MTEEEIAKQTKEIQATVKDALNLTFKEVCADFSAEGPHAFNAAYTGLVESFSDCVISLYNAASEGQAIDMPRYLGNVSSDVVTYCLKNIIAATQKDEKKH